MQAGYEPADPVSNFAEAVAYLESGINYEKTRDWHYDPQWLKLPWMEELLRELGNPHQRYRIFHVAGTKGKGTTATAIAECLRHCGYRTGLLTSPHLITPRERIRIDGHPIPEEPFWRTVRKMQPYVEAKRAAQKHSANQHQAPTYFEMLTALAFDYFAAEGVEWAAVEVGLGGRLDSTNVVSPRCCVITSIALEHTERLGNTPEAIAGEKGGILKTEVPVVIGRQLYAGALEVLRRMADERGCPRWEVGREITLSGARPAIAPPDNPYAPVGWHFHLRTPLGDYGELLTPLLGAHQLDNLAASVGALDLAATHGEATHNPSAVAAALRRLAMPGRVEVLHRAPVFILDVAHTVESVQALLDALSVHFPSRPVHVVFGCSSDKNAHGMLQLFRGRCASVIITQSRLSRAMPAEQVAEIARQLGLEDPGGLWTVPDSWEAALLALQTAAPTDIVCVTGSFFVAGEVRAEWLKLYPATEL